MTFLEATLVAVKLVAEIALTAVGYFVAIVFLLGCIFEFKPREKREKGNSGGRL